MTIRDEIYYCRVCGLRQFEPPWGEDGKIPSYDICSCCGVEFGNEDYTLESIKSYRIKWMSSGAKWFDKNKKPTEWSLERQLDQVPEKFR
jgi:hypothetical protein